MEVDLISAVSEAGSGLSEAESLYEQFTAEDEEFHRMEEEKKKKKSSSKDKGSRVEDK